VRRELVDEVLANANGRVANARTATSVEGLVRQTRWRIFMAHVKAPIMARILDGGKDGGAFWEYFIRPANERANWETTTRAEATRRQAAILEPIKSLGGWVDTASRMVFTSLPKVRKESGRQVGAVERAQAFADELYKKDGQPSATENPANLEARSFNRQERFAIALNTGNLSNLQRLLGGEGWTFDQLRPVLESLTLLEWEAVQATWDHFETFKPLIAAKQRRVYGVEPEWIEAQPFEINTADGKVFTARGGYYPVKFDPMASQQAEQHDQAAAAKQLLDAAYTSATTRPMRCTGGHCCILWRGYGMV
jgi:hypothetical protein